MDEHIESSKLEEVTSRESVVQERSNDNRANNDERTALLRDAFREYFPKSQPYQGGN